MPRKPQTNWRRTLALPEARLTRKYVKGVWYGYLTAGRHKGAPVLGRYQGASAADLDNAIADDEDALRERYNAIVKGMQSLATIGALLDGWERSAEFTAKAQSTQRERSRVIASIKSTALGKASASVLRAPNATGLITKWRDQMHIKHGARAADYRMEVLNAALNWHVRQGHIAKNPAAGIPDVCFSDRSDLIWEPAHVEAYRAYIRAEINRIWLSMKPCGRRHEMIATLANAYDALTVALNTGMRRADIALFAWIWARDGAIIYTPSKGRNRARTAKKAPRTVVLPILPEMARLLARRAEIADSATLIPNRDGQHYQPKGIGDLVAGVAKACGIERHLHDAKGTFVTMLSTNTDLTDEEIAKLVDWSVASVQSIIRRYVSGAAVGAALLKRFRRA